MLSNIKRGKKALSLASLCLLFRSAEAYPTEFRNTGVASCHAFGRIGAASAPIFPGIIIGLGHGYVISFLFYVIPSVIGLLAAAFLVKKQTKGKSLDEQPEIN